MDRTRGGVIFAPLKGGLPSREPQILKSLILCVCVFGFSTRFAERQLHRLQAQILFGLFFRGPKPDPPFRQRTHGRALQRGPKIFDVFSIFVQLKCACSDGLFCEIEIGMSPQFLRNRDRLLDSQVPLSGGQTAPRVQTSLITQQILESEFWSVPARALC